MRFQVVNLGINRGKGRPLAGSNYDVDERSGAYQQEYPCTFESTYEKFVGKRHIQIALDPKDLVLVPKGNESDG